MCSNVGTSLSECFFSASFILRRSFVVALEYRKHIVLTHAETSGNKIKGSENGSMCV